MWSIQPLKNQRQGGIQMTLSNTAKQAIKNRYKARKPGLEVEVNNDGSVFFFEDAAHISKRNKQKGNR